MSAPYQASKALKASIERMRSRTWLDEIAAAFESGVAETWSVRPKPQVADKFPSAESVTAEIRSEDSTRTYTRAQKESQTNRHERRRSLHLARRRPQRSPDKQKSHERRHRLAFSGPLPPQLAARFTVGQMACLRIVGDEHRAKGCCALSLDEIGARAGVARKTAQRALRRAGLGSKDEPGENLLTIEERRPKGRRKHLPNMVRITSPEWLTWLARRGAQIKTGHLRPTTDTSLVDDGSVITHAVFEERAQSGQPSKEAIAFADELAIIAGHRRNQLPEAWRNADPPQLVQVWINALVAVEVDRVYPDLIKFLRTLVTATISRKPDPRPPHSPRYFWPTIKAIVDDCARSREMILGAKRRVAA
jgi:hypothetical protein